MAVILHHMPQKLVFSFLFLFISTTHRLAWNPMNTSIEQLEFRIFHNIFCHTFKIQKEAFAFDEYAAKVFQKFALELIEIRLVDWFYVTVILCLNLGRVKLNLQYMSCERHDVECDEKREEYLFTIVGKLYTRRLYCNTLFCNLK
jgi:hypothetical protein